MEAVQLARVMREGIEHARGQQPVEAEPEQGEGIVRHLAGVEHVSAHEARCERVEHPPATLVWQREHPVEEAGANFPNRHQARQPP